MDRGGAGGEAAGVVTSTLFTDVETRGHHCCGGRAPPRCRHDGRIVKAVVFVPELGAKIEVGKLVDLAVLDRDIPGPEDGAAR